MSEGGTRADRPAGRLDQARLGETEPEAKKTVRHDTAHLEVSKEAEPEAKSTARFDAARLEVPGDEAPPEPERAATPAGGISIDAADPAVEGGPSALTQTRGVVRRKTSQRLVADMPAALPAAPAEAPKALPVDVGTNDRLSSGTLEPEQLELISGRLERGLLVLEEPGAPGAPAPAVIEVVGLTTSYGERTVLRDVYFEVRRGEILVILGGSGSGKTTLLRHMIGLLKPDRGTIRIGGRDLATLEGDELSLVLKTIGMSFQYSALFSTLTAGENVALPLREYTDLPDAAIRVIVRLKLALVGLPGIQDLMPSQLSGGMRKRVALARAVVLDPDIVFFDEPASGLDPIASAELDALLIHLNRALGTTMVIVTHDLENAFNVAHRILVLDRGLVVAVGTPAEIRASQDPWVRAFVGRETSSRDAPDEQFYARLAGAGREKEAGAP